MHMRFEECTNMKNLIGKPEGQRYKLVIKKGKVHPCTCTEALYRPYGP